jgi:hypothetical protein
MGWILERPPLEAFQTLALMPIAGIAIWAMKNWSYPVFLVALVWSAARNISNWGYARGMMPLPAAIATYLFELVLVGYFLHPNVRKTYFDPNVRWWESKPRFVLKIEAELRAASRAMVITILNLSEGGLFITAPSELVVGDHVEIGFNLLGLTYSAPGKLVHSRTMENGTTCFGVQFEHTPESAESFRRLARGLEVLGFKDRGVAERRWESLKAWMVTLATTGKGLVPEPQMRTAGAKPRDPNPKDDSRKSA